MTDAEDVMNKFIFLDVDGVLNNSESLSTTGFDAVDGDKIERLKHIVKNTNATIILSSTWRLYPDSRKVLDYNLGIYGLTIKDITPDYEGKEPRAKEIYDFLALQTDVESYVVIDDCYGAGHPGHESRFVQTTMNHGLQDYHVHHAIQLLEIPLGETINDKLDKLKSAARLLVEKLKQIDSDPTFNSIFVLAANRGQNYTGPSWGSELKELEKLLS